MGGGATVVASAFQMMELMVTLVKLGKARSEIQVSTWLHFPLTTHEHRTKTINEETMTKHKSVTKGRHF